MPDYGALRHTEVVAKDDDLEAHLFHNLPSAYHQESDEDDDDNILANLKHIKEQKFTTINKKLMDFDIKQHLQDETFSDRRQESSDEDGHKIKFIKKEKEEEKSDMSINLNNISML